MELKQQLKQFAGSSYSIKQSQSDGGDRQVSALRRIEKKKHQTLEVVL